MINRDIQLTLFETGEPFVVASRDLILIKEGAAFSQKTGHMEMWSEVVYYDHETNEEKRILVKESPTEIGKLITDAKNN